jgi:hypothetical protein
MLANKGLGRSNERSIILVMERSFRTKTFGMQEDCWQSHDGASPSDAFADC